jgi:hypothetical protein
MSASISADTITTHRQVVSADKAEQQILWTVDRKEKAEWSPLPIGENARWPVQTKQNSLFCRT